MNVLDLHADVWQRVQAGRDRMAHALLFVGPAGNFKVAFAYELAASLLCEASKSSGRACASCSACNWFAQGNHPDFRWLRPESMEEAKTDEESGKAGKEAKASREITIDQVRGLIDFLNVGTHRAGLRVILITPAEAMNRNTANALLKSLEEPKPGTVFLLVSDHPERLLPTIRSRCRVEPIPRPQRDMATQHLIDQGVGKPDHWIALAGGVPRLAMEIASGNQKRLLETLEAHLALGSTLDPIKLAMEIESLLKSDRSLRTHDVIDWTQRWVHDLVQASTGLGASYYLHRNGDLLRLSAQSTFFRLSVFVTKAMDFKRMAGHPLNPRLFFEDFFSEYVSVFQ